MAKVSWFSDEGDDLAFGRYVERLSSWQQAMADGHVSVEEVRDQAQRVADMLRDLEERLDDDVHELVTDVFLEWSVLQGLQSHLLLQEQHEMETGAAEEAR